MKNILFLIILGFLVANCATARSNSSTYPYMEEQFHEYVDDFVKDSKGSVTQRQLYMTSMEFDDLEGSIAGMCIPNPLGSQIYVDVDWWNSHTDRLDREQLIYHELGHCVLLRMHTEPSKDGGFYGWLERLVYRVGIKEDPTLLPDRCPISYMDPYTLDSSCINSHRDYYIEEMFHRANIERYKKEIKQNMRLKFWDEYR